MTTNPTVLSLSRQLEAGATTSEALVEASLAAIAAGGEEAAKTFTAVHENVARDTARAQDLLRRAGQRPPSPLAGIPVSIKDLFDEAGRTTLAGSKALVGAPPAERDADAVARLRAAGAVVVGRTNMTEFAFSGVGINPHYGTPGNPADPDRIPGGSSSGAGVSVAAGYVPLALGTDTGGSVRIPAALCGVVGFKPTQRRVSLRGTVPLSWTLDSIGPLARTVECCAVADAVLAGEPEWVPPPVGLAGLRFAVPQSVVLDGLAEPVARAFDAACRRLSEAGARIVEIPMTELAAVGPANARGGFPAAEAIYWHRDLLDRKGDLYDPRVRVRIERGRTMTAADYIDVTQRRADLIARADRSTADYDALLMPTVPITAPRFEEFAADSDFTRLNILLLRNCALFNFLDRCAISLPMQEAGSLPCGLMLVGATGADRRLLAVAGAVEPVVAP
ncbi:amidase [Azospirillum rugosum]|uniref:Aspartyl-tRNA(Asn)/glutamyl-tRNA(Gln) amidotransferase subunit A n=1 Tax=Azospirillum rugosum TaxID=416170 RepID=A0ABS4SL42_9PROT|nr:amidase [Azospirillum rugosum]MBP2292939.1 aspartyl-tRNA(Asn)/glutamyl-tRNA(Gln) amidotransferase subunit A [Azospirillum rugosum]MDQ0529309.1 aspartyl-tRNA(Asn)/glutamyl-tRNA(Gln) amidotransferase subunit A [Azospirillum rugosum]